MKVTAHQEKKKNEETKEGKSRAGEKKMLPFCGRSGGSIAKK